MYNKVFEEKTGNKKVFVWCKHLYDCKFMLMSHLNYNNWFASIWFLEYWYCLFTQHHHTYAYKNIIIHKPIKTKLCRNFFLEYSHLTKSIQKMMMSTCHGVAFEFGKILGNHTEFMEVDYISLKVLVFCVIIYWICL